MDIPNLRPAAVPQLQPLPSVQADASRGDLFYETFYQQGGWKYSSWKEYWWHRRHVFGRFALRKGQRMLEAACGNGFHTHLFNRMGYPCIGVDRTRAGIAWAKEHYPRWTYECADVFDLPFEAASFDVAFTRGCSTYHYDLSAPTAIETTRALLRLLRPGGRFILVIATDLTGRRCDNGIWQNRHEDFSNHFATFNGPHTFDWVRGMAICSLLQS